MSSSRAEITARDCVSFLFQETFVAPTQENSLERIARTKSSKFISKSMGKENNDVHC